MLIIIVAIGMIGVSALSLITGKHVIKGKYGEERLTKSMKVFYFVMILCFLFIIANELYKLN